MPSLRLRFYAGDENFKKNLHALRRATIEKHPHAPAHLDVFLSDRELGQRVVNASTAHIRPDGWLAYTDDTGERRVPRTTVQWVEAWWEETP
jgi:hypothetical protein